MRTLALLAASLMVVGFVAALTPADARPSPVCVNPNAMYGGGNGCYGFVCVDDNLNGKFGYDECTYFLCPEYGCCTFDCPPPPYE